MLNHFERQHDVEAARAGIPAVASDLRGAREIVEDGVTGFIYAPRAALGLERLRRLAADPALRTTMGAAARRRFESEFGVSRMVQSYVALWTSLLATGVSAQA